MEALERSESLREEVAEHKAKVLSELDDCMRNHHDYVETKEAQIMGLDEALEQTMRECEERVGEATQRGAEAQREMLEAADAAQFKVEQAARERERAAAEVRRVEESQQHLAAKLEGELKESVKQYARVQSKCLELEESSKGEIKKLSDEIRRMMKANAKLKFADTKEVMEQRAEDERRGIKFAPRFAPSPLLARVAGSLEKQMKARVQSLTLLPNHPAGMVLSERRNLS